MEFVVIRKKWIIEIFIVKYSLKKGIFHQKVGILEDSKGNKISFSGSDNETAFGWKNNIEEFKVFRSWVENEKPTFCFYQKWSETHFHIRAKSTLSPFPDAIEKAFT